MNSCEVREYHFHSFEPIKHKGTQLKLYEGSTPKARFKKLHPIYICTVKQQMSVVPIFLNTHLNHKQNT